LHGTEVTSEGVAAIEKELPGCKIKWDVQEAGQKKKSKKSSAKTPATAATLRVHKTLKAGGSDRMSHVVFSPDGRRLAATGMNRGAICDLESEEKPRPLKCSRGIFGEVVFSADGQTLIALTNSGTIRRLDVATGKDLKPLESDTKWYNALAVSPDGSTLAASGAEGQVFLWDLPNDRPLAVLQPGNIVPELEISGDDTFEEVQRKFKENASRHQASSFATSIAFSPDGKSLALCGWNLDPSIWDVAARRSLFSAKGHTAGGGRSGIRVSCVCFSPDARLLASCGDDGTIRFWDVATGQARGVLEGHAGPVSRVAFHPSGKWLASVGGVDSDGTHEAEHDLRLWDVPACQETAVVKTDARNLRVVCFSPDGKSLVTNGKGSSLVIFDWP
jgi:WD40 repeat protein